MPTYEYRCRDCGQHLEIVQSFRDDPLTECPRCSGALRKVFQPIGIAFKGTGFYKTDSRSSTTSSSRADSGSKASDSSSGSSGSDSSGSSDGTSGATSSGSSTSSDASGGTSGTQAKSA